MASLIIVSSWSSTQCLALEDHETWRENQAVPIGGRPNPYQLKAEEFEEAQRAGRIHAFVYPVSVTGSFLPYEATKRFLDEPQPDSPLRLLIQNLAKGFAGLRSLDQALAYLGLHKYPQQSSADLPIPQGMHAGDRIGLSILEYHNEPVMTFGCAGCHVGNLFGRPILGLTNRFPRANEVFVKAKHIVNFVDGPLFRLSTGATQTEQKIVERTLHSLQFVAAKKPETLGLDTSLAHVALSLARRSQDSWASRKSLQSHFPRAERLLSFPADSKPAVWWNIKFKNRWLSDGSVLSGNPIVTNLLWNELGRGSDLHQLQDWMLANQTVIRDLTTAVFSSRAPHITEFFPAERFDIEKAKAGEKVFRQHCAGCHGNYEKAWSLPKSELLPLSEQLKTLHVHYPEKTKVIDVGTDPHRHQGMRSLLQLNELEISRSHNIRIQTQKGYVPPPLEGIWARWPYLHNNSVPSLCELLTPEQERQVTYWSGDAQDRGRDFDFDCNGYPMGEQAPASWKNKEHLFDSRRRGLSNRGHSEGILIKQGKTTLNEQSRMNLIRFLQTL